MKFEEKVMLAMMMESLSHEIPQKKKWKHL